NLENLEKKIAEKIVEKMDLNDVKAEDISPSMPLFSSAADPAEEKNLGLDSVDGLELVVLIYEEWGIKVEAEDMPRLTTIGRIAAYIREKLGTNG
ncbi:MAG: phosphopantetheine-binding protein, partial [Synergistaceae bacterium]|nr:phosphopantetheine-binding protein [Synergistaceae bacterium]